MLLSEVSPVITVGRRTPKTDFLLDEKTLGLRGIELIEADRGGLATYHGPGQWVVFPVDRLERLTGDSRGVRAAVDSLLRISQKVALKFGVETEIRSGPELGVWTETGKISAVGIHIEKGILFHGLSFNVFRTPESFLGIRPCGLNAQVDFLAEKAWGLSAPDSSTQSPETLFQKVEKALVQACSEEFPARIDSLSFS